MILYQIFRPMAYLKIKHPSKWKFDWLLPSLLSIAMMLVLMAFKSDVNVYGTDGLISRLTHFIGILPGFFIAALAAIATFNRKDVDLHMPEPTPKIDIVISGEPNTILLTRRRFLCMLFSFLTAQSIFLAVIGIFSISLAVPVSDFFGESSETLGIIFLSLYVFVFSQMLVSTFHGLYYLGDRLHQPD